VETDSAYYTGNYSLFDKDDAIAFRKMNKNFQLRKKLEPFKNFEKLNHFSKNWFLLSKKDDLNYKYENIRFGGPINDKDEAEYVFSYKLKINGGELEYKEDFNREKMKGKAGEIFGKLWSRILGNK
ncbi:MAG: hypothetical protein ACPG4Y_09500, partial [Chitinophagales bacterium]